MKEVKHSNGRHWTARCPECDAWHVIKVMVRADLVINPGSKLKIEWDDTTLDIVCGECLQPLEFLLSPEEQRDLLQLAYRTR